MEKNVEFEELCKPLIKYLCDNYHPHTSIYITQTHGQLFETIIGTKLIDQYLLE